MDNSTYFNKITSSVTGWWSKPKGGPNERERVLSCTFDTFEIQGEVRQALVLLYARGVQVWDITSPDNVFEIYSERGLSSSRFASFVPTPIAEEIEGAPFLGLRPILAVVEEDETQTKALSIIKFVSMRTNAATSLHLKHKVLDFQCNRRALCVVRRRLNRGLRTHWCFLVDS